MACPFAKTWVNASVAAPNPGVFVTAPQSTPTIIGKLRGSFVSNTQKYKTNITRMFNATMPQANRFNVTPPFLKDSKNPGPTCKPIQYTNSIKPKSCKKFNVETGPVNPKCPAKIPANNTNVTPNEMPKNLIFPK